MITKELLTDKERVSDLFSKLRKAGIVAKQNFRCCSTCAGYELANTLAPMTPVCFYHGQDAEVWTRRLMLGSVPMPDLGDDRVLHLRYGFTDKAEYNISATPAQTAALGMFIARLAHDCGLGVMWDRDPAKTICLTCLSDDKMFTEEEAPEVTAEVIAAIAVDPTK
jgi:hypothetical protein